MSFFIKNFIDKYATSEEEVQKIKKLFSFEDYVYQLPLSADLSDQMYLHSLFPDKTYIDEQKSYIIDSTDGRLSHSLIGNPEKQALKTFRDLSLNIEGGKNIVQLLKKQQEIVSEIITHFEHSIAEKERSLEKEQTYELLLHLLYSNTIFSDEETGKYPVYDLDQPVRYFYIIHEEYLNPENSYFKLGITNDLNVVCEKEKQQSFRKTWSIFRSVSDTSGKVLEKCQAAFKDQHIKDGWYKLGFNQLCELYTLLHGKTLEESIKALTEEQMQISEKLIAENK